MTTKLYVGNLSYSTMDHQLEALFSQHGKVMSAAVVVDNATGRSRGFGFVEFDNDEEAQAAIAAINGTEVDGRTLTVNVARPRVPRGRGGGGGGGRFDGGGGPPRDKRRDRGRGGRRRGDW